MSLTLSPSAAEQVKQILEAQKCEPGTMVRLGIGGGGCSGLAYSLGLDTSFDAKTDVRYESHGVGLVTSKKFDLHLDGTTIDVQDGPRGPAFSVENPNYRRGGGCPGCGGH